MKFRPTFKAKNFASGLNIIFDIYDKNHNLISTVNATEWGNTGNYYVETGNIFFFFLPLLVIARTPLGEKIDSTILDKNSIYRM